MKKVMVFIDGSNLYHNLKSIFGSTDLDYAKFISKLIGSQRELVRTYYYNCPLEQSEDSAAYKAQQRFFEYLYRIPDFEVRLGRLQLKKDKKVEKGVDVKLATDMLSKAFKNHYDVAILISGDGDFVEVVNQVKDLAKHVELVVFPNQKEDVPIAVEIEVAVPNPVMA